jgi:ssDNA-binding replication factor A large subunit
MSGNFEKLVEKIANSAGVDKDEIQRKIEAKRAKLSGLISEEGAAQIVAAELGVTFENENFKVEELVQGMRKVNVVGKAINLSPVRTFKTKKGEEGKVLNFMLADNTSNVKVVLWDVNHIALFEGGKLSDGSSIEILNGSMRGGELHLGSFSELKPSTEVFENAMTEKIVKEKKILDFAVSDNLNTRAFVVQTFAPKFFYVCPECKKKATTDGENFVCLEHGKVVPEKRALINIVLDDGSETIRAVLFNDFLGLIGLTDLEDEAKIESQRQALLGKEMVFSGNVRMNNYFNQPEFIVDGVKEVNLDELISKLEA